MPTITILVLRQIRTQAEYNLHEKYEKIQAYKCELLFNGSSIVCPIMCRCSPRAVFLLLFLMKSKVAHHMGILLQLMSYPCQNLQTRHTLTMTMTDKTTPLLFGIIEIWNVFLYTHQNKSHK